MGKSYYMLSDIVFGLREEYKKNEERLNELTKYSMLKNQGHDLHFGVVGNHLTYDFILDSRNLCGINKKMLCGAILKKTRDYYKSDNILEITDSDSFNQEANDILNSEFNKNISLVSNINQVENVNEMVHINMNCGSIHLNLDSFLGLGPVSLHYFSMDDKLVFDIRKCGLFTMEAFSLLETSIFSLQIPSYHKKIIDDNYGKRHYKFAKDCPFFLASSFDIDDIGGIHVLRKSKKNIFPIR